eukprot:1153549-Pelagomonas_calceolata.AAC.2
MERPCCPHLIQTVTLMLPHPCNCTPYLPINLRHGRHCASAVQSVFFVNVMRRPQGIVKDDGEDLDAGDLPLQISKIEQALGVQKRDLMRGKRNVTRTKIPKAGMLKRGRDYRSRFRQACVTFCPSAATHFQSTLNILLTVPGSAQSEKAGSRQDADKLPAKQRSSESCPMIWGTGPRVQGAAKSSGKMRANKAQHRVHDVWGAGTFKYPNFGVYIFSKKTLLSPPGVHKDWSTKLRPLV